VAGRVEREQRRAATREVTRPVPAGLLPAAAIDGKLLHGTVTVTGRMFLVAAIGHRTGTVLGQRQVADKRGENTAVEPMLAGLDVTGMVLTLDALNTTKKTARLITDTLHTHYILILKANQPLALQAAQALLSGTDVEFAYRTDIDSDRGHGRTERRALRVVPTGERLFPRRPAGIAATPGHRRPRQRPHPQRHCLRHHQHARRTGRRCPPQPLRTQPLVCRESTTLDQRCHVPRRQLPAQDRYRPRALATFRNLAAGTYRLAGRANIAYARRELHDRADVFTVYGI
jgi:hypothetical protein